MLPNLLVDGISDAVRDSPALKVFVCNIMTEAGETDGFGVAAHIRELERLGGVSPDWVLVNTEVPQEKARAAYEREGASPVLPENDDLPVLSRYRVMARSLVGEVEIEEIGGRKKVSFHDPARLGRAIMELAASAGLYSINRTDGRRIDVSRGAH